ncbi:MAG: KH domain-containing protein [Candidatus Poribacteria bacterium]|nr:KH domain-containing protein [Candidatus Poribacteria bacterium]
MKELIEYIVKLLVDSPDEVQVTEYEGRTIVYELSVAEADIGKVIGRQGRTVHAIRTVLTAAAARQNKRAALEIIE